MAGSTTPCLFCGKVGVKLTGEHVYPLWLRRALNLRGGITYTSDGTLMRVAADLDTKVREVCSECNNGWLHDLERAFRSVMLLPLNGFGPVPMPQPVQVVVSLWAVKTWLLIERAFGYARGGRRMEFGPEAFHWMREHREPPPQFQVWTGAITPESAQEAKMISFLATQWVGDDDPPVGIIGVFSIGSVLFVIYTPIRLDDKPAQSFALGIGGGTGEHLREIWPHQVSEVSWPPPRIFSADQLEVLWPSGGRIRAKVPPTP